MTPNNITTPTLVYNGEIIRDKGDMLSLTDMWRASDGDDLKRPSRWLEQDATQQFVEVVASANNVGQGDIIRGTRGRNGATFAHWQIALAYAKYLSPEFHMWCNEVVRDRMEGLAQAVIPADAAEQIERSFGIARMLSHKVTGLESTINALTGQVQALIVAHDPRRAVLDYVSTRQLLDEAGAVTRRRNGLNRKIGNALRNRAILAGHPMPVRRCPHSGVWLFQRDFADRYMTDHGRELVIAHNEKQMGQGVLRFPNKRDALPGTQPDAAL